MTVAELDLAYEEALAEHALRDELQAILQRDRTNIRTKVNLVVKLIHSKGWS